MNGDCAGGGVELLPSTDIRAAAPHARFGPPEVKGVGMTQRSFLIISGSLFTVIASVHAFRLIDGWPVIVGTWSVPMWVSAVGLIVAGYFAHQAFASTTKNP